MVGGNKSAGVDRQGEIAAGLRVGVDEAQQILHRRRAVGNVETVEIDAYHRAVPQGELKVVARDKHALGQPEAAVDLREQRGAVDRIDVGRRGDRDARGQRQIAGHRDIQLAVGGDRQRQPVGNELARIEACRLSKAKGERQCPLNRFGIRVPGQADRRPDTAIQEELVKFLQGVKSPLALG